MRRLSRVVLCLCCAVVPTSCTPTRAPRASAILYTVDHGGAQWLQLVTADGSQRRVLAREDRVGAFGEISPDGSRALYDVCLPGPTDPSPFWAIPYDGSRGTPLPRIGAGSVADAHWSPDGASAVVSVHPEVGSGPDAFYVVALATGASKPLPVTGESCAWSPRDNRIAILRSESGQTRLWLVDVGTLEVAQVPCELGDVGPGMVWSPDGRALALRCIDGWVQGIVVVNIADGTATRVTEDDRYEYRYIEYWHWSPDGSKLLIGSDYKTVGGEMGTWAMFLVSVGTGREARLHATYDLGCCPVWSPDGEEIAFLRLAEGTAARQIYKLNLASGKVVKLTDDGDTKSSMVWAMLALKDGQWPGRPAE